MGRTSWNVEIHREEGARAVQDLRVTDIRSSRDRAGAHRDDDFSGRHRVIRLLQCQLHVPGDGSGDQESVGMTRRGDDLDTETAEVPSYGLEDVDVCFAGVAAPGADLPQLERPPEQLEQLRLELPGEFDRIILPHNEIAPIPRREAIIRSKGHRPLRTGRLAFRAEEAAAQVQRGRLGAKAKG